MGTQRRLGTLSVMDTSRLCDMAHPIVAQGECLCGVLDLLAVGGGIGIETAAIYHHRGTRAMMRPVHCSTSSAARA